MSESLFLSSTRARSAIVACCAAMVLMAATRAQAQQLYVGSAREDSAVNQLVIRGGTYAAGIRVFLNFVELPVVAVGANDIQATLGSFPPASYLLLLYQPATNEFATF